MAKRSTVSIPLGALGLGMLLAPWHWTRGQGTPEQPRDAEWEKPAEEVARIDNQPITTGPRIPAEAFHLESAAAFSGPGAPPALPDPDLRPRLVLQTGGDASAMVFSPDGRFVATSSGTKVTFSEAASGREIRRFVCPGMVEAICFSPDGRYLASAYLVGGLMLWEVGTGKVARTFPGAAGVSSVAFSADGRQIVTLGGRDVRRWNVETGKESGHLALGGRSGAVGAFPANVPLSRDGGVAVLVSRRNTLVTAWDTANGGRLSSRETEWVEKVVVSPDGRYIAGSGMTVRIWEAASGREISSFPSPFAPFAVRSVLISTDGGKVAVGGGHGEMQIWQIDPAAAIATAQQPTEHVSELSEPRSFSTDGRYLAGVGKDGQARIWLVSNGVPYQTLGTHSGRVTELAVSSDGESVAVGTDAFQQRGSLWDLTVGKPGRALDGGDGGLAFSPDARGLALNGFGSILLYALSGRGEPMSLHPAKYVTTLAFSPNGQQLASGDLHSTIRLWDVSRGEEAASLKHDKSEIRSLAYSHSGQHLASAGGDDTARLWDVKTAREIRRFDREGCPTAVAFSRDDSILLVGDCLLMSAWEVDTGKQIWSAESPGVDGLAVSPDGTRVASANDDRTVTLWDVKTGRRLVTLAGHEDNVTSVAFSADGGFVFSGSADTTVRVWSVASGREVCQLVSFYDGTWAVVDPEGRYDASNGGDVEGLHWVVGNEPIALYQLKERYYDPGLLAKIMGFKKEPLREVKAFRDVAFYPEVKVEPPAPGSTTARITLTNRGGGIGKVRLLVNGKEIVADARGPKPNALAPSATLSVDLAGAALVPGQPNTIRVLAWNAEGYLSSRGTEVAWTPEGTTPSSPPELYAIVGGISSYGSDSLRLRYAGKDAEDMATALAVGAKRLFGAEKVHLTLLATSTDPNAVPPTKAAFREAFEKAKKARPSDILVVYLAGHGIAFRGDDGGDLYAYLTAEARSTDSAALKDSAVRQQTTITSEELTEWTKAVPAFKQVMILDTCAAAAAAEKLVEKRDVENDDARIRALDRLKDRTGFHVLMGSAANAVSYEASQYGQGILTYALLQGMRGAALKEQQYVDVSQLFQYAADQVPQLAKNIGGIQRPQIAAPRGSSFDIGQLTSDDKTHIPLAMVRPLVLRPLLISRDDDFDSLNLMPAVQRALAATGDVASRGSALVFVDADELPGALRPSGSYTRKGAEVTVTMNLIRDGRKLTSLKVQGQAAKIEELGKSVAEGIANALPRIEPDK